MKKIIVMKNCFKKSKKTSFLIGILSCIVLGQAFFIAKLYSEKDDKNYEVNLVQINTQKDSVNYLKMKQDLGIVDQSVRELNGFLNSKNISNQKIEKLDQDSLSSAVYLAKQTNRYSKYLVDLQNKLQQVPLGMPTEGWISSNFGIRKNPIPPKPTLLLASINSKKQTPQASTKDSLNSTSSKNTSEDKKDPEIMQFHKGLDIAAAYGSNVLCTAAGKVIFAGVKGGYGNCVIVSHGNGLDTLYGHLSEILVKANDQVKVGQTIAKSGNTGRSTGPHLHYEVHKNGTPINPKLFLNL